MLNTCYFYCEQCKKERHFVPLHRAFKFAGVSRSTMYYWIDKQWVHWRELPSGRRIICEESLSHSAKGNSDAGPPAEKSSRKGTAA